MTVLVTIQHPAHVHFFKTIVRELADRGHEVHVVARKKDIALDLLEAYQIPYTVLAGEANSTFDALRVQTTYEYNLLRFARRIEPDVLTAIAEPGVAHVGTVVGAKSLLFTDTEHTRWQQKLTIPFVDRVCTPSAFAADLGAKHVTYEGYHELAYLHPDRFEPDPEVLTAHGIDPSDDYFVLRSIAWDAVHDFGKTGFSRRGLRQLASLLSDHGEVYITSEMALPDELKPYRLTVPVQHVHDLLAYANGYVGDSGTMATEAAILGTPAVRADPFAAEDDAGNFVELERKYRLLFSTPDEDEAIAKVREQLDDPHVHQTHARRRDAMLADKIDVTAFAVEQLESLVGVDREVVVA